MVLKKVNEDLQKERKKCDFNVEELTHFLDGGAKYTNYRRDVENQVLSVKGLLDVVPEEYLSHKEKYENAIRKAVLMYRTFQKLKTPKDLDLAQIESRNLVSSAVFKEISPFLLHSGMFVETIVQQGTEEQQALWLKRARNMEIIGTYAQTELGHGTFIRGLETTATYDAKTEEFILHSPSITAYKWWPGGLAHTTNYCVVMAHLFINGKSCGIQPFMVQIRDEETHQPLPGIKLGEIGAKMGFNTVNNGFLGFENFRIPRNMMMMKNAQVLKDGTFKASANSKLAYGTMVFVRVTLLNTVSNQLAKAVTIALRYSAVRRQSQLKPDEPEPQILDYVTQQHKLFIAVATTHALTITARWLWNRYKNFTKDLAVGKLDQLPEMHSLACCLKAVSCTDSAALVERCRLSCGGHGYMLSSNLPQIYSAVTATCTYEGENTVLMLQTARSLVKAWHQASKGEKLFSTMSYISEKSSSERWENSVDGIVKGFKQVAKGKLEACVNSIQKYTMNGLAPEDAWNMTTVQLVSVSEAHGRAIILEAYKTEMDATTTGLSSPLRKVMYQLLELYAIYWGLEKLGDMLLYTSITKSDVQLLQRRYEELLGLIRPNAVGLVDAFDFRDEILSSALGSYDGRVYERLMEEALKSPLNAEPVNQSFQKYLKPFMQGKL